MVGYFLLGNDIPMILPLINTEKNQESKHFYIGFFFYFYWFLSHSRSRSRSR